MAWVQQKDLQVLQKYKQCYKIRQKNVLITLDINLCCV